MVIVLLLGLVMLFSVWFTVIPDKNDEALAVAAPDVLVQLRTPKTIIDKHIGCGDNNNNNNNMKHQ